MPAVLTQTWAAGNSSFGLQYKWVRGTDGTDPLYPEIEVAEDVLVSSGRLVWAGAGGYDGAGIVLKTGSPNGFPAFDGGQGYIEVEYTPNTDVMATSGLGLFYVPLVNVFKANTNRVLYFDLDPVGSRGNPYNWRLGAAQFGATEADATILAGSFTAGTAYVFRVEWKCGTPTGSSPITAVASDGWVRFYLDGVLVHEFTGIPFYIDDANNNFVQYVSLASDVTHSGSGLFGSMGAYALWSGPESAPTITATSIFGENGTIDGLSRVHFTNLDGVTRTLSNTDLEGSVVLGGNLTLIEQTTPPVGVVGTARLWVEDDGSGKMRLLCQFPTGSAQQIAIEP